MMESPRISTRDASAEVCSLDKPILTDMQILHCSWRTAGPPIVELSFAHTQVLCIINLKRHSNNQHGPSLPLGYGRLLWKHSSPGLRHVGAVFRRSLQDSLSQWSFPLKVDKSAFLNILQCSQCCG